MDILIHATEKREKYLDFLLNRLPISNVYIDSNNEGNIKAYMKSFQILLRECDRGGDTWHFEDDVLPDKRFLKWAEQYEDVEGIVCGFGTTAIYGKAKPEYMWYSFPCIRIPNYYLKGFERWVREGRDEDVKRRVELGKGIDFLFHKYVEKNPVPIYHTYPCMVEHIDDLIGGSLINERDKPIRAVRFEDTEAIEELKRWLEG